MKTYTEGALVRITATFSVDVDSNVFFELDDEDPVYYGQEPDSGGEANFVIVIDSTNTKKCWVDIDTMNRIGQHECHFYARGQYKAGEKRKFQVV